VAKWGSDIVLGRDCCEEVERKHWDDKKTGVLIKLLAVLDTTD
jgi:hypothetical protein